MSRIHFQVRCIRLFRAYRAHLGDEVTVIVGCSDFRRNSLDIASPFGDQSDCPGAADDLIDGAAVFHQPRGPGHCFGTSDKCAARTESSNAQDRHTAIEARQFFPGGRIVASGGFIDVLHLAGARQDAHGRVRHAHHCLDILGAQPVDDRSLERGRRAVLNT